MLSCSQSLQFNMISRTFSMNLLHFLHTSLRLVAFRRHWLMSVTISESRVSYRILTQKFDPLQSAGLCYPRDCVSFKICPDFGSSANIFKIMIFYFPLVGNSWVLLLNYIRKRVKDVLGAERAPQTNFLNCPFSFLCKK